MYKECCHPQNTPIPLVKRKAALISTDAPTGPLISTNTPTDPLSMRQQIKAGLTDLKSACSRMIERIEGLQEVMEDMSESNESDGDLYESVRSLE